MVNETSFCLLFSSFQIGGILVFSPSGRDEKGGKVLGSPEIGHLRRPAGEKASGACKENRKNGGKMSDTPFRPAGFGRLGQKTVFFRWREDSSDSVAGLAGKSVGDLELSGRTFCPKKGCKMGWICLSGGQEPPVFGKFGKIFIRFF